MKKQKATLAAKAALNLLGILHTDLKFIINKYIIFNWQDEWNNMGTNKLCSVSASPPTDYQDATRLSSIIPILVRHSLHIFLFGLGTIRLSVSTVSEY